MSSFSTQPSRRFLPVGNNTPAPSSGVNQGGRPVRFSVRSNTRRAAGNSGTPFSTGFFKGGPTGFRFLNRQGNVSNVQDKSKLDRLSSGRGFNFINNPLRGGLEFTPQSTPDARAPGSPDRVFSGGSGGGQVQPEVDLRMLLEDPEFAMFRSALLRQERALSDPLNAELARLEVSGQSEVDELQRQFGLAARQQARQASASGLGSRSGALDVQRDVLAQPFTSQLAGLQRRESGLREQLLGIRQAGRDELVNAGLAAAGRQQVNINNRLESALESIFGGQ